MTRRASVLLALLFAAQCKGSAPGPTRADAVASQRVLSSSSPPAPSLVAAVPAASADASRECAREHWPEPWRPRQTTTKPLHSVDCAGADCVRIDPVIEKANGCAEKCRAVSILPRAVSPDPARARAIQAILDAQTTEYRSDDCWLTFLDYAVHHDANGVLDVSFRASGSGAYPSLQTTHVAIDLAKLERIRADAAFSARSLAELVSVLKRRLAGAWNAAEKAHPEVYRQRDTPQFRREHLENFVVHSEGVTFLFDFGLPHVIEVATPESEFSFTQAEIRRFVEPKGPLGFLAAP